MEFIQLTELLYYNRNDVDELCISFLYNNLVDAKKNAVVTETKRNILHSIFG